MIEPANDKPSFKQIDADDMLSRIQDMPWQCQQAWEMATNFDLPQSHSGINKVIIIGMGGSAIGGDFIKSMVMTEAAATRCRIVMVAIHSAKPTVDLFKFFWREIELLGARVYEPEDFEHAIQLISSGAIDCQSMITDIQPLDKITSAFEALSSNAQAMKSLIQCS